MAEGWRRPHPGEEAGRARGMAAAEVREERGEGEWGGGALATRWGTTEVREERAGTWPLPVHGTSPPRCADSGPLLGQRHAAHPPSAPQIHRCFSQIRRSLPFPEPAGSHGTRCVRGPSSLKACRSRGQQDAGSALGSSPATCLLPADLHHYLRRGKDPLMHSRSARRSLTMAPASTKTGGSRRVPSSRRRVRPGALPGLVEARLALRHCAPIVAQALVVGVDGQPARP